MFHPKRQNAFQQLSSKEVSGEFHNLSLATRERNLPAASVVANSVDFEAFFALAIGFGMLVVLPITALLLAHQRKMAEMISQRRVEEGVVQRLDRLEQAVLTLQERLNDLTLAVDDAARLRLQARSSDEA
jgi:uncharacterized protein YlxW (UPF0749 family)